MASCAQDLLESVAERAKKSGAFGDVRLTQGRLLCQARDSAEPAEYRLEWDAGGRLWVALVTPNRWLSESIETDLLHTGDKMEELVEDELVDLGYEGPRSRVEHFRSEDLLFTFRSQVPLDERGEGEAANIAATFLMAYEACFRQLGDMSGGGEED